MNTNIVSELHRCFPAEDLLTKPEDLMAYSYDGTALADGLRSCARSPMAAWMQQRNSVMRCIFCLGCLACKTACPSGVDYTQLFETARATAEQFGALKGTRGDRIRGLLLKGLFTRPRLLRAIGRALYETYRH